MSSNWGTFLVTPIHYSILTPQVFHSKYKLGREKEKVCLQRKKGMGPSLDRQGRSRQPLQLEKLCHSPTASRISMQGWSHLLTINDTYVSTSDVLRTNLTNITRSWVGDHSENDIVNEWAWLSMDLDLLEDLDTDRN